MSELFTLLVAGTALFVGCGDGTPDTSAEAAEEINKSGSGLVRISEENGVRAVAKYLTPAYLATAELPNSKGTKESRDSLTALFSRTMSFHISVSGKERRGMDASGVRDTSARTSGVTDVESLQQMFRLESGGRTWSPVCAIPESRVGDADRTWFVVFPVDAGKELRDKERITVIYTPPDADDSGVARRFTYNVEDLLRPEFIASNN